MKRSKSLLSLVGICVVNLGAPAYSQACFDLLNLTFINNSGDVANHPYVSNITPWTNGSIISDDPFFSGLYMPPVDDFGNGYAGLTADAARFGYQWGFEGSFDVTSSLTLDICSISFDYDLLGHNGEADLTLQLGTWIGHAPLPSTDGPPNNGPIFTPVSIGERATGSVLFDFANDLLTVTRNGYSSYTTALPDMPTMSSGTQAIDIIVANTNPLQGDGYWDANAGAGQGQDAFYRIDNFRVRASQIPEPSTAMLSALIALGMLRRRRD